MVNDQEPRYRLVDSNGNVVGSLFQNADGNVEIQDETGTGSVFGPDGIVTPAIDTGSVNTDDLDTGRDWEDVTGSRSFDTTETNDTDSEIKAYVQIDVESDNTTVATNFDVDGGLVDRFFRDGTDLNDGDRVILQAPAIPPGSTYEVVAFRDVSDYTINTWREFRP